VSSPPSVPGIPAKRELRWVERTVDWRLELGISTLDYDDPEGGSTGVWNVSEWSETGAEDGPRWGGFFVEWVEITGRVLSAESSRGRERFDERIRPGTGRFEIDNSDGLLNPITGELPNALRMRPGRAIRLSANAGEGWIPVFTGFADRIDERYRGAGFDVTTVINASDTGTLMAVDNPPALETPTPIETTTQRITRILDAFGWPYRELDTSSVRMRASTLGQSRFEEAQRAADAEGGAFYFDGEGTAIFRNREWSQFELKEPSDIIGGPLGLPIVDVDVEWTAAIIVNDAQYARIDGEAIRQENPQSQALYGTRTRRRFDLQCQDDTDVEYLASRVVERLAYDRLRVNAVTVHPFTNLEARRALALAIGDVVTVTVSLRGGLWSYTTEASIQGIAHRVTASDWEVTYQLEDTQSGPPGTAFDAGFTTGFA